MSTLQAVLIAVEVAILVVAYVTHRLARVQGELVEAYMLINSILEAPSEDARLERVEAWQAKRAGKKVAA